MRINCIMHVAEEGPAAIGDWAKEKGHSMSYTHLFAGDLFPALDSFDMLLVMGGPMSYDDDDKYTWMRPEKAFVKEAIDADKSLMGICLGAQIIAEALGSEGRHSRSKEIGWFPVSFDQEVMKSMGVSDVSAEELVFHWHADTFKIPEGATRFASTTEFPNQAYVYNNKVLGIQFHLEANVASVNTMVNAFGDELIKDQYIQTEDEILALNDNVERGNALMFQLLSYLEGKSRS